MYRMFIRYVYVLVSYGAKPQGSLHNAVAAKQQLANFGHVLEKLKQERKPSLFYDYQRSVEGLDSLPKLKEVLDKAKAHKARIWIDDFRRLFVKCPLNLRQQLMKDLLQYSGHFGDIKMQTDLAELKGPQLNSLLLADSPLKFVFGRQNQCVRPLNQRLNQTSKATLASRKVRTGLALRKAEELSLIKTEMEAQGLRVTLNELALEANTRGLKTTRNGEWSASTVLRALERLKK